MSVKGPRYSGAEFARRGSEIYSTKVAPAVGDRRSGEFVAIDIESGEYEIDRNDFQATERLLARQPDAQIWLTRVGRSAAYRIGNAHRQFQI